MLVLAHLFVKVRRSGYSEVTFSVFKSILITYTSRKFQPCPRTQQANLRAYLHSHNADSIR